MLTVAQAHEVIEATAALKAARSNLFKLNELRPRSGRMIVRGYTTTNEADYEISGAEYAAVVVGYIRKKHETMIAHHERRLRALGAEIPK